MGQVCQKCGDGDLICSRDKNNGPMKPHRRNGGRGTDGPVSLPNSDMTFQTGDRYLGDSMDQGHLNTFMDDLNLSNIDPVLLQTLMDSNTPMSQKEI